MAPAEPARAGGLQREAGGTGGRCRRGVGPGRRPQRRRRRERDAVAAQRAGDMGVETFQALLAAGQALGGQR
ncbi:hypothetical protein, partial [Rubrivivax gelatinosus]|uniref:hypothetical protein n=1 Tax=Rubrivivax gelatinosus TaxID=28068 RepID=UPI003D661502